MDMQRDIKGAKQQVIEAGRELSRSGLIARTWGNVSCRIGPDAFVITASGRSYLTLTEEEVVKVNLSDLSYQGEIKPSSEKKVHRVIYQMKPEAGFVIHTHQSNASAVSAMGLSEIPLDREYPGIGNKILCAGYGLPGSKKLCRNTGAAVEKAPGQAVIMAHHGAVCYGKDYAEAFQIARDLERACGVFLQSLGIDPWREAAGAAGEAGEVEEAGGAGGESASQGAEDGGFKANGENGAAGTALGEAPDGSLWNTSPIVRRFTETEDLLKPYLDDFAQLAGTRMKVVEDRPEIIRHALENHKPLLVRGRGALCAAGNPGDREALSLVIEKNCRAHFAAKAKGGRPIAALECAMMRQIYLRKYARLSEKEG